MDEASLMMMMMIGKTKNALDKRRNEGSYMVLQYMYCKNWNHPEIKQKISQQHIWKA
jgi:hypothetical protein